MYATARNRVSLGDGFALGLIATGAISIAVAALVAVVKTAVDLFGGGATVRMPLTGGEIPALRGVEAVSSSAYAAGDVTFATLPTGASWLLLLEMALPALSTIGVCVVAWWLGVSLMRSRPFRPSMTAALVVVACLVIVGGVVGQVCGAFGRALLAEDLAAADPAAADVFPVFLLELDLTPVGWGFALALVAGAFAIGARLERDTAGLV